MSTDAIDNKELGGLVSPKSNLSTYDRLEAWVKERPIIKWWERSARQTIVNAAKEDAKVPPSLLDRPSLEKQVLLETEESKTKINGLIPASDELVIPSKDGTYVTRFRREPGDVFVAEEVKPTNFDVISQARIFGDGRTELTLNFTGSRYEDKEKGIDRNPKIFVDKNFPKTTATVFNLLVGTVKNK